MPLYLNEDQTMLRDTARGFMADEGAIAKQLRHWRDRNCKDGFWPNAAHEEAADKPPDHRSAPIEAHRLAGLLEPNADFGLSVRTFGDGMDLEQRQTRLVRDERLDRLEDRVDRSVAFTVDDGYYDWFEVAAPVFANGFLVTSAAVVPCSRMRCTALGSALNGASAETPKSRQNRRMMRL